jgi:hypothetical protein
MEEHPWLADVENDGGGGYARVVYDDGLRVMRPGAKDIVRFYWLRRTALGLTNVKKSIRSC